MQPWSMTVPTVSTKRGCINADGMHNSMMQLCVWLQVGGVLAELQAEQARLRQLCSEQAAAMQSLQRQAQQAAKYAALLSTCTVPQMACLFLTPSDPISLIEVLHLFLCFPSSSHVGSNMCMGCMRGMMQCMYTLSTMRTQLQDLHDAAVMCVNNDLVMCPCKSAVPLLVCRAHGIPEDHTQSDYHHKAGSHKSTDRPGQVPSRHWGPSAAEVGNHRTRSAPGKEKAQEEDSLDAFVVETRLVPVSLSQIPDQLLDHVS